MLRQLRYYCAIVEHENISKAAQILNIAQPALSRQLKELEAKLDATLIIRKGNHWQLTDAGKLLYDRAKKLLRQLESLPAEINDAATPYNTSVLIGASPVCFSYLASGISKVLKIHPQIHFRLFYGDISYMEELIRTRKVDFAMFHLPKRASDFIYHDLPISSYSVVYPSEVLPLQPSLKLQNLKNISLIVPRRGVGGGVYERLLERIQTQLGYNPVSIDSQDIQTLSLFLDYGVQAAILLPTSEVHPHIRERYHVSLLDEPDIQITPCIAYHRDQYLSQAAQFLIDQIMDDTVNLSIQTSAS